MMTAAEERAAAVGGPLDAAGDARRDTRHRSERLTQMGGGRRRSDPPGASWDLLMVTVVLVRAVLPASSRVMLTQ